VAEGLRLCAIYLGIAIIVTAGVGVLLPGLRDQIWHMHKALLVAMVPAAVFSPEARGGAYADPSGLADIDSKHFREGGFLAGPVGLAIPDKPTQRNVSSLLMPTAAEASSRKAHHHVAESITPAQAEALRKYIAHKYRVSSDVTSILINTAYQQGHEFKLDPLLLLAVIAIESAYNPFAESSVGAQGLMQVMTSVHQAKFDVYGKKSPLDPVINMQVGSRVLRDCLARRGSLAGALSCYVGASGASDGGYGERVLAERRRLSLASGIALARH
jgi:hypothetical protein